MGYFVATHAAIVSHAVIQMTMPKIVVIQIASWSVIWSMAEMVERMVHRTLGLMVGEVMTQAASHAVIWPVEAMVVKTPGE